jgi:hypothetical protein
MSKPLVVSIPHNLGRAEALRRLQTGLAGARTRFAGHLLVKREDWTGDHLEFEVAALKQEVSGTIDVGEHDVTLSVVLPWMLAMLAEKAKTLLTKQGTLMLEKK